MWFGVLGSFRVRSLRCWCWLGLFVGLFVGLSECRAELDGELFPRGWAEAQWRRSCFLGDEVVDLVLCEGCGSQECLFENVDDEFLLPE